MSRCFCGIAIGFAIVSMQSVEAQDEGKVEGAIWKYEMSQIAKPNVKRSGLFRVHGEDIYQPRDRKPTKIGTIVGKPMVKPKKGDRVQVAFTALRGNDRKELKCKGRLISQGFGKVRGRVIDSDGKHWNFKTERVQE